MKKKGQLLSLEYLYPKHQKEITYGTETPRIFKQNIRHTAALRRSWFILPDKTLRSSACSDSAFFGSHYSYGSFRLCLRFSHRLAEPACNPCRNNPQSLPGTAHTPSRLAGTGRRRKRIPVLLLRIPQTGHHSRLPAAPDPHGVHFNHIYAGRFSGIRSALFFSG